MKNILTIIKKELCRFFTDKRMLATLILPGLLIYFVYSLMGGVMKDMMKVDDSYTYSVYVANQPASLVVLNESEDYDIKVTEVTNLDTDKDNLLVKLKDKDIDLFIVYEADFDSKMLTSNKPSVEIYYNSVSTTSQEIYNYYNTSLFSVSATVDYLFYVNADVNTSYDQATKEDISSMMMTMIMPFLLTILLFSGCMTIAIESIAGEKERGTIATLLVTPVKRSAISIGKIVALSITALVSALSSFLGLILSLPKLMEGVSLDMAGVYGVSEYLALLGIIIVTVLLFTVVLSIVSCFAKSVKEANTYATPVMIVVMVLSLVSSYGSTVASTNLPFYFIPVLNSVQCMTGIFSMTFNPLYFVITIISNLVYVSLGVLVLNKMFDSEKMMFNK
ncbi:MAG: ABC transporter permease [Clostridia bacterium]|nr:ABC transporter permease [Clostridia bacterium]